jgi:hypothetical protein
VAIVVAVIGALKAGVGLLRPSIFCYQSAVAVRISTWLSAGKFAFFSRGGPASRARYSECLFWAGFFLHGLWMMPQNESIGLFKIEQNPKKLLAPTALVGDSVRIP